MSTALGSVQLEGCSLCASIARPKVEIDFPLASSENFIAIPSLGSLVEGWVLLVPKAHYICIGAMPALLIQELEEFKQACCLELERRYGRVFLFEHGPSGQGRRVGCGVDHAHLHIVPIDGDLLSLARPYLPDRLKWLPSTLGQLRPVHEAGLDYLYAEQFRGTGVCAAAREFSSQVFRRAIASSVGRPSEFNWREHPEIDTASRTIRAFRPLETLAVAGAAAPQ